MLGFELDFWDYATFADGGAGRFRRGAHLHLDRRVARADRPRPQPPGSRGGEDHGLGRVAADRSAVDPGLHLGVQAHRHRRHPAISEGGGEGARRRSESSEGWTPWPPNTARRRIPRVRRATHWRRRDTTARWDEGLSGQPMLLGFVLLFAYGFIVWLVFFKFRWLKFTIAWGFFSTFFVLHLGIIFLIGLRFVAPTSTEARVIQHTIQLTPRLSEPTLVTAVLVEPNVQVKKRHAAVPVRPAHLRIQGAAARGATRPGEAERADHEGRHPGGEREDCRSSRASSSTRRYQQKLSTDLAKTGAGPEEDAQKWGRRSRPTTRPSRKRRPRSSARGSSTSPRSAASTPRWRRPRPSSTRRVSTSTTR